MVCVHLGPWVSNMVAWFPCQGRRQVFELGGGGSVGVSLRGVSIFVSLFLPFLGALIALSL